MQMALEALLQVKPLYSRHDAIAALRQALANEALDKMAENARELGLNYEPAQKPDNIGLVVRETTCRQAAPKVVGYGDSTLQSGG